MNEQILYPFTMVYCENCKKEFPASRIYINRRIDQGKKILCASCQPIVESEEK